MKESINSVIKYHHDYLSQLGFEVVMTVLVGSQNYKLDDEESDIDTCSFVLPSLEDICVGHDSRSGEINMENGKCVYRDIRIALNNFKKSSPNSVEYFLGKYRYINPKYSSILNKYLNKRKVMDYMVHSDYDHMFKAIVGMAYQITNRNMSAGKRYSHCLRLLNFANVYFNSYDSHKLLEMPVAELAKARSAKRDANIESIKYYDQQCVEIAHILSEKQKAFIKTPEQAKVEQQGVALITQLQKKIVLKYLEDLND